MSGKTLCYVITIIETLLKKEIPKEHGVIGALVLVPTRFKVRIEFISTYMCVHMF